MSQVVYRTDRELRNYKRKLRRQKEIRRNVILAVAAAVLVILFALSFHTLTSFAEDAGSVTNYKYFTSIQVEKGDTLWSIAEEYADDVHYDSRNDYIIEVMAMNNMSSDELKSGQYLLIPYYSSEFVK